MAVKWGRTGGGGDSHQHVLLVSPPDEEIIQQVLVPRLGDGVQIRVKKLFVPPALVIGGGRVDTDDNGELDSPKRQVETHQASVDALQQTSHGPYYRGSRKTRSRSVGEINLLLPCHPTESMILKWYLLQEQSCTKLAHDLTESGLLLVNFLTASGQLHFETCLSYTSKELMSLLSLGRQKRANRDADLSEKFRAPQTVQYPETEQTLVQNLSSKRLTETQKKVLRCGFGFNTTEADPSTFIASFESALCHTGFTDEAKDLLRHQVSSLFMSYQKTHSLVKEEQKALRELKTDAQISVTFYIYGENEGQLRAQDLIELMEHCLKTFFTFEGITYEQIRGTPMGSSFPGLIAEMVLQKLERRLFEEDEPKFWARFVDNTFIIIEQHKIAHYEERLNSILPDLQFTMEEEVEVRLPLSGVLVCHQPDG
ncbi:unnamed protein product [Schistocephalus solidus]|uniref:Reverse transcriptase domain-containing protein n=1 Tax=Schistocephalus solidus TaxID=70667 RepID=A0A183SSV6_SCHSO|nr:unnamed protein product [Schistocephalus solidus]